MEDKLEFIHHSNGTKYWYLNGECHRENGPAMEFPNGTKFWFQHAKLHRIDGPAVEYSDGSKAWYLNDKYINCSSQEEFERLLKLKAFW